MRFSLAAAAVMAGSVLAQRPTNTSICDYYTTALLKNNTAANQYTILTLLVNTVVIGNYTKPTIPGITFPDIAVSGILANGTVNGTAVNLLPYFDGGLASSNRGGSAGVSVNFLDDGGAVPLMMNKPANGTTSNQYMLLTHLYQFFGSLLGCSQQGMPGFSAYVGQKSMYSVHQFMDLNPYQVAYFIDQVALAAESFGVAKSDISIVGAALSSLFDYRCAPATTVIKAQGPALQSICIADTCPIAPNSTCNGVMAALQPGVANSTLAQGEGNMTSTATSVYSSSSATATGSSSSSSSSPSTGAAATNAAGVVVSGVLAMFAFLL